MQTDLFPDRRGCPPMIPRDHLYANSCGMAFCYRFDSLGARRVDKPNKANQFKPFTNIGKFEDGLPGVYRLDRQCQYTLSSRCDFLRPGVPVFFIERFGCAGDHSLLAAHG